MDTGTKGTITASHWGAFRAALEGGSVVVTGAFENDPDPSPMIQGTVQAVRHKSRVANPSVRRSWLEGGPGCHKERRGTDPFVEISWEQAERLVASELDRVRTKYGNSALYGGSYGWSSAGRFHHAKSQLNRFFNQFGGCTASVGNYSMGAGMVLLPHVLGSEATQAISPNWDLVAQQTDLFLCFGGLPIKNVQLDSGGVGKHLSAAWPRKARRRGAEFVCISPVSHDVEDELYADWIPIRPNTDTALLLALAHGLYVSGQWDREYVETHCVGFDQVVAYLLGVTDGVEKSAEWAASISGVEADITRFLISRMVGKRCFINLSLSTQRSHHGEMTYWAGVLLASMLGQIGAQGGGVGFGYMAMHGRGNPVDAFSPPTLPSGPTQANISIPVARITDMLLQPGETIAFNGSKVTYPHIHLIYWCGGNPFHHHQDLNRMLRGLQNVDTIVVHEPWWTPFAKHADIVLPATTTLERNDIMSSRSDRHMIAMKQVLSPVANARNDFDIFRSLSARLGFEEEFAENRGELEWIRHIYETSRAITRSRHAIDLPDFETFWEDEYFELPAAECADPLCDFYRDPEGFPIKTPSGRIELFSERIAAFNYSDCPGHPFWMEPAEWLGSPRTAAYPLHLLSNQPANRLHSQLDMTESGSRDKVAGREAIQMHPEIAGERGITNGDVVRVFNDRGAFLAVAKITKKIARNVVLVPTGAWFDPDQPGCIGSMDRNSNPNVVTLDIGTSQLAQATSAQTVLVNVERYPHALPELRCYDPPLFVPI